MGYCFSFISLSKPGTERGLDISEITLLICGLVLAYGAAGEYIEEHGTLPRWMKWSRRPKLVFVWMVALSLVGEFVGDAGVFLFSGQVQSINDDETAGLNKEAATLGKQAEDERIARVEIEDRVAWRRLTKSQIATLASQLRRFTGQIIQMEYQSGNPEAENFAHVLAAALKESHWIISGGNGFELSRPFNLKPITGLQISEHGNPDASRALIAVLNELGFDAIKGESYFNETGPQMYVVIFGKPEGPQGEAKLREAHKNK